MKTLDRRTVLRGMGGITLGLPWLEAMGSPGSILGNKNVRLAYLFMPNGVRPEHWNPASSGALKLSKTLAPLEPVKDMVNVHSGLTHPKARGGDGHYAKTANFLSGETVKKTTSEIKCGISCDQVAAKMIGQDTYLPSIELAIHKTRTRIDTNVGFTQVYGGHISWSSPTTPVPKEIIPSQAYQRLFKGAKTNAGRTTSDETKSLLDYVKSDTMRLQKMLGSEDRTRVAQYFHSVRSLEKRLNKLASQTYRMPRDAKKPPEGIPGDYQAHVNLMLDIIVLAFQTNRTRIASFMFGNAVSGQRFDFFEGVSGSHHENSHCNTDKTKIANVEKIARWHVTAYSKMLQKMHAVKEGDNTLLDNSLVLFGSGLKDGNKHSAKDLPLIVGGKGGGDVKTGKHMVHNSGKMNSLLLGMMQTAGCQIKKFGDSDSSII